jgi:hypothetical protein
VPQLGQDADAARFKLRRLRVLILVDHVLAEALGHEHVRLRLHPGGHEGRQVEAGVAVQDQLVPHHLQRGGGQHAPARHRVPGHLVVGLLHIDRVDVHIGLARLIDFPVQGHGVLQRDRE